MPRNKYVFFRCFGHEVLICRDYVLRHPAAPWLHRDGSELKLGPLLVSYSRSTDERHVRII
jgi:hypothetical protein